MLARRADDLIALLTEYIVVCDLREDHNAKVISKRYKNIEAEKAAYYDLEENHIHPLAAKCVRKGFGYSELWEIIPMAYATNFTQRRELLKDLKTWSIEEFGDYDIPI